MNDSRKVWVPNGPESAVAMALSVTYSKTELSYSLYLDLLTLKLDALIQADPVAARRAMEMSPEHAPGLWSIAMTYPRRDWAGALARSDQVTALLGSWKQSGSLSNPQPQSLTEILELIA